MSTYDQQKLDEIARLLYDTREKMASIEGLTQANTQSLQEHMKRTVLNEDRIMQLETIQTAHLAKVDASLGFLKWAIPIAVSVGVAIVALVARYFL